MIWSSQQRENHDLPTLLIDTYNELTSLVNELGSLLGPLLSLLMTWTMGQRTFSEYFRLYKLDRVVGTPNIQVAFKHLQGWHNPNVSEQCISVFFFCYLHRKKGTTAIPQGLTLQADIDTALVVLLFTGTSTG